ncbi:hypothetical protein [Ekhidna sp.]
MSEAKTSARLFKASIKELPKEVSNLDTKLPLYKNGADNLYPERIERIIDSSPTASAAVKKARKYTIGKGIADFNKKIINPEKQKTGLDFLTDLGNSYWRQKGAFVHVTYKAVSEFKKEDEKLSHDLKFTIDTYDVIPYTYGRKGKKDDKGHYGKIGVYEGWDSSKGNPKEKDIAWIDVFNPRQDVIRNQIEKAPGKNIGEKIKNYKGQILFFNPSNSIYPLAHIDPAYNDADTEARIAIRNNTGIREGFMGITYVVTPPLMGDYAGMSQSEIDSMDDATKTKYRGIKSEAEGTSEVIESSLGAENNGRTIHLQMQPGDNLAKMEDGFLVKSIESNIKPDMYEKVEKSVANNIRKSINSIPSILIERNESALFGNSGEMLREAKLSFQEECEEDKMLIEGVLETLFKHTEEFKSIGPVLEPLIEKPLKEPEQ